MDSLTTAAAAGMRARLEALDLLANNLANSSTSGFKADREAYSTFLNEDSLGSSLSGQGLSQGSIPVVNTHATDFSQGALAPTGSPQDLALSGPGFFLVRGAGGPLLTRAGRMLVANDGRLVTPEGNEFESASPRKIRADPMAPLTVEGDGTIRQSGAALGQIRIVSLDPKLQPPKREGVYFSLDSSQWKSLSTSIAEVRQGMTEASNFSAPEASARLISVLRQFEALQRALQLGGDMGRKAVEEVARVNP
jgi:flagellar basal-body rod protein FlgF